MRTKEISPRDEARSRFERHIAAELAMRPEVDTRTLATDFYNKEERLLRRIAAEMLMQMLVKWAIDILNHSVGNELIRNGGAQLVLPMSLTGIEVPGAISFIGGANRVKFAANYKVVGWQCESHSYLMRKKAEEVTDASNEWRRLWEAVRPFMDANPTLVLPEALKMLAEQER